MPDHDPLDERVREAVARLALDHFEALQEATGLHGTDLLDRLRRLLDPEGP